MSIFFYHKTATALLAVVVTAGFTVAQQRKPNTPRDTVAPSNISVIPSPGLFSQNRSGPKPYKDIITSKAITGKGIFTVHKVEDKWYFELPDSVLSRDILVVNRLSKAAAGMRNFSSDMPEIRSVIM